MADQEDREGKDGPSGIQPTELRTETHVEHAGEFALGELLKFLSHQLQIPLATLVGTTAAARLDLDNPSAEALEDVKRKLDQAATIAERMGRISHLIRGLGRKQAATIEPFDLLELLEEELTTLEGSLVQAGASVYVALPPSLPSVLVYREALAEALHQLLRNALEALGTAVPGGREIMVSIESGVGTDMLRLTIRDSAGGIPADVRPRIFEPFFTTREGGHASGLGLPLARALLSELGGRLGIENGEAGCIAWVEVPAAPHPSQGNASGPNPPWREAFVHDSGPARLRWPVGVPLARQWRWAGLALEKPILSHGTSPLEDPDGIQPLLTTEVERADPGATQALLALTMAMVDHAGARKGFAFIRACIEAYFRLAATQPLMFMTATIFWRAKIAPAGILGLDYHDGTRRQTQMLLGSLAQQQIADEAGVPVTQVDRNVLREVWNVCHGTAELIREGGWRHDDVRAIATLDLVMVQMRKALLPHPKDQNNGH